MGIDLIANNNPHQSEHLHGVRNLKSNQSNMPIASCKSNHSGASMPHIQNYLDLDPTYKDVYGMPLLRMTYDYTAQDRELVKYMAKVTRSIAKKMGPDHIDTVAEQADFNVNTDTNTA